MSRSIPSLLALVGAVLLVAAPARAEVEEKTGNFEIFPGWYFPENESLVSDPEDGFTYGVRGGYYFTQRFGVQLGLQGADLDYELNAPLSGAADISMFMADVSFIVNVNPDARAVFHVFGGPGYSWTNTELPHIAPNFDDDDNVWTAHVGIGTDIQATERFYIRPDVAIRWFSEDEDDTPGASSDSDSHTDWQFTLGFGWRFGG